MNKNNANYTHPNRPPHSVDYTCDGTVERCIGIVNIGVGNRQVGNVRSDRRDQDIGNVRSDRRDQDNGNVGDFTRGFLRAKRIRPRKT
jgi:hypothetical protein